MKHTDHLWWRRIYRFADRVESPEPGLVCPGQLPAGCRAAAVLPAVFTTSAADASGETQPSGSGTPDNMQPWGDDSSGITRLIFAGAPPESAIQALRITFAAGVKEEITLEAVLLHSRRRIGCFDVRYAYSKQMFEIPAAPEWAEAIYREGIGLRMTRGTMPVWLLWGKGDDCAAFAPHLLLQVDETAETAEPKAGLGAPLQTEKMMEEPEDDGMPQLTEDETAASAGKSRESARKTSGEADMPLGSMHKTSGEAVEPRESVHRMPGYAEPAVCEARLDLEELVEVSARMNMFCYQLQSQIVYHRSGWMEGCVLDGLYDIYRLTGRSGLLHIVRRHLRQFIADNSGSEEHAGPRVQNGKIVADVTERTLPYAVLARVEPGHPAIDTLIGSWLAEKRDDGAVYDRETDTITGEGVYTAGYPMAAVAAARGRDDLAELALRQLYSRKERLAAANGIYLRSDAAGRCTYLNWARAWAWYLLGAARILLELGEWARRNESGSYASAVQEFARASAVAASMQQADGLWTAFVHEPVTGAEAGGSAGIAAAFALGAKSGLLDASYLGRAEHAWAGLCCYVTPDGLLGGVSQTNQGGEELQRSGYRVLFQMGMGLMAQLGAALGKFR